MEKNPPDEHDANEKTDKMGPVQRRTKDGTETIKERLHWTKAGEGTCVDCEMRGKRKDKLLLHSQRSRMTTYSIFGVAWACVPALALLMIAIDEDQAEAVKIDDRKE